MTTIRRSIRRRWRNVFPKATDDNIQVESMETMANLIDESQHHLLVTTTTPDGRVHRVSYTRGDDEPPFTMADLVRAKEQAEEASRLVEAGVIKTSHSARTVLFGRPVYYGYSVGDPTWWLPKAHVRNNADRFNLGAGWLRWSFEVLIPHTERP